jgi:hypothetical protein
MKWVHLVKAHKFHQKELLKLKYISMAKDNNSNTYYKTDAYKIKY